MFRKVYRRGTAFGFGAKLYRWWIKRSLHKFGREFRAEKIPVIACFSNDFVSNSIFVDGFYEREDLEAVVEFLKEQHAAAFEGLFVDVGANIGNHSLFFSSYFSQVIAIEPNPRTFRLLAFNAEGSLIRCKNLGVSEKPGEMRIQNYGAINSGRTQLAEDCTADLGPKVPIDTLDNLLLGGDRVSLIKVDVEGMELEVFRGSTKLLREHSPAILFEQSRADFLNGSSAAIEELKRSGYRFFEIVRMPSAEGARFPSPRWLVVLFLRLTVGERIEISEIADFTPDTYNMLIAVPTA